MSMKIKYESLDSVKRCDDAVVLHKRDLIIRQSHAQCLNYLAIEMKQEDALDEVHEFLRWYATGNLK